MKSLMRSATSCWCFQLQMSYSPVSMVRMGSEPIPCSHFSCLSCTFFKYQRVIASQPLRPRCLMRYKQSSGAHLRYTIALKGQFLITASHTQLYIVYSATSRFPQWYIISPKTQRSASGERSEQCKELGCSAATSCQRRLREWMALSWKVKAQRLGLQQQLLRMLKPPTFCHSSTGSLMEERLRKERSVLLPAPRLPSIDTTDIDNRQKLIQLWHDFYESLMHMHLLIIGITMSEAFPDEI